MTRRDVRREATHAAVLDAARTIFFQRGYEAATIMDIAREAGVSVGTVLNAAPSKASLLIKVLQDEYKSLRQHLERLGSALSGSVSDRLLALMTTSLKVQARYRELLCSAIGHSWLRSDTVYDETYDQLDYAWEPLKSVIEQGQSSGELRPEYHADDIMSALQDLYLRAFRKMHREGGEAETMAPLLRARLEILINGCRA